MLKIIDKKAVNNFLLEKPNMNIYIQELYNLLSEDRDDDWYLSFREVLIDTKTEETISFLELRTGLIEEITEEYLAGLDQYIADCLSSAIPFLLKSEGMLNVSYCALTDLENAYKQKEEEKSIVIVDHF